MSNDWIECRPGVLGGKACIRGTRISVEHVLELLASGATPESLIEAHPQVSREALHAALAYAASSLRNESVWLLKIPA